MLLRLLSFFQGLYNKLAPGRNKDEKFDLVASDAAFPKYPAEVPGVFSLGFKAKVSRDISLFVHKVYVVQMWDVQFVILHFIYYDIDSGGSPARLVYNYLKGFFKKKGSLLFKEYRINIKDDEAQMFHNDAMKQLANELMQ